MSLLRSRALGALLASCAAFPALAADEVSFMIDWLPAGDKAAVYYGVQSGIFAKHDLDVTVMVGRGSSDVVTKLATGTADVGTGGLSALLQAKAGGEVPVKALASIYTKQPDAIFTYEGSGIEKLADVAGKKIATATFSSSNVSWPLVLESIGVDPASVEVLKVDPGALGPMLAAGRVDATINWLTVAPAISATLDQAGKTFKSHAWSDYGYEGYGLSLFVSETYLAENPEVVDRLLAAYQEATAAAIADPKAAAEALKAMVPEVDVDIAIDQWTASIPLMVNEITEADGMGAITDARLATSWAWVSKAQGLPEDALDLSTVVAK
ncbi:ABC transporter substrate-binding protein [Rhodovulum sp. DZ06]|uniref:ABC transporter substrate-binding protein n=1 Tax=Rhodovulum sp. DZ06 TaxID=3425126 RepID=UPI003D353370